MSNVIDDVAFRGLSFKLGNAHHLRLDSDIATYSDPTKLNSFTLFIGRKYQDRNNFKLSHFCFNEIIINIKFT